MNPGSARRPGSMQTPRLKRFGTPTAALAVAQVPLPTAPEGEPLRPSASADPFTPQELAAWRGLLEVHARVIDQLDAQMQAEHGLTLSQSEVLILLDDAPGQRMRMAELAEGVLLSRSACTRLVDRLETLGYVTRHPATDDRRGLYAQLTDTGRHVITPARATHREGVREAFLDRLRATDQVALSDIWARVLRRESNPDTTTPAVGTRGPRPAGRSAMVARGLERAHPRRHWEEVLQGWTGFPAPQAADSCPVIWARFRASLELV